MKRLFIPFLTVAMLATTSLFAQDGGGEMTINLKGDATTESAAKLELIRILQERLNKLTVSQLNSRVIVSKGVINYYKVEEIFKMQQEMWNFRSAYVSIAGKLEKANPAFAQTGGNGFAFRYMAQYNKAMEIADLVKKQAQVLITSGTPIVLPAMPTFNISPASSDPGANMAGAMTALMSSYGVSSQAEFDALPADKKAELQGKMDELGRQFKEALQKAIKDGNKQTLSIIGNVIGTAFGVPGAGTMVTGLLSGNASAVAGLVGSIVDQFQIPSEYYNSPTLKLTDAERIKMIDELHLRISEAYQQTIALGASMSAETKKRYDELSTPRNDAIMYGTKKQ